MRVLYTSKIWFSELEEYKGFTGSSKKFFLDQSGDTKCRQKLKAIIRKRFSRNRKSTHWYKEHFNSTGDLECSWWSRHVFKSLWVLPVSSPGHCPSSLYIATHKKKKKERNSLSLRWYPTASCSCSFHPDAIHMGETLIWQSKASRNLNFPTVFVRTSNIWWDVSKFLKKFL